MVAARRLLLPVLRDLTQDQHKLGGVDLIHALLVVAVVLFIIWLVFHAAGAIVNLIWLVIIVLVVLWLVGFLRGRAKQ